MRYWVQCDCTSRATQFAAVATDYAFDAEYISHVQSTPSPLSSILLQWNLENRVPSPSFLGKTFVVIVSGSL